MSDANKTGSAPVRTACFDAGFVALPIEVLLAVVPHTGVVSAIQMTQVSDFIVVLGCRSENQCPLVLIAAGLVDLQGPPHAARKFLFLVIVI